MSDQFPAIKIVTQCLWCKKRADMFESYNIWDTLPTWLRERADETAVAEFLQRLVIEMDSMYIQHKVCRDAYVNYIIAATTNPMFQMAEEK